MIRQRALFTKTEFVAYSIGCAVLGGCIGWLGALLCAHYGLVSP